MTAPTLMAGVSSGGTYPAAGVTCAAQGIAIARAATTSAPRPHAERRRIEFMLLSLEAADCGPVTWMFQGCKECDDSSWSDQFPVTSSQSPVPDRLETGNWKLETGN